MGFFDRLGAGWRLAKASWAVVLNDKTLMVFPLLALLAQMGLAAGYFMAGDPLSLIDSVLEADGSGGDGQSVPPQAAIVLFLVYFVFNAITIFFNVALIGCAIRSIGGEDTTVGQGLTVALSHLPGIFVWAAISSVVGVLLSALERNGKIGEFVSSLLGAVWSVMTYFVIPIMVVEKTNPFTSIGRSKTLIFRTWGEGLGGHLGAGFISFLASLPGILVVFLGVTTGSAVIIGIGVVLFILAMLWGSTASSVLRAALYCYASNQDIPDEIAHHARDAFYRK